MIRFGTTGFTQGLSVVIPVWNDHVEIARLLCSLLALPTITEIIVVDDGSDIPISPMAKDLLHLKGEGRIRWMRNEVQKGAGHARNIGISCVATTHVLFIDADDDILPNFQIVLNEVMRLPLADFDFCIFRHVDSRQRNQGRPGPLDSDQVHWRAADISTKVQQLTPHQTAQICRISTYPWNKVYRTDFLRENDIQCTEIPVHNDIELHWRSFFHAKNIYASDSLCVEHVVIDGAKRLTNREGNDRLRVFEALEPLRRDMRNDPGVLLAYLDPLVEFYLALFHWITSKLNNKNARQMKEAARSFLLSSLSPPMFSLIALRDPRLASRVNDFLERGAL